MLKRILAISAILSATTIAWMMLGANIQARTSSSGSRLKEGVESVWGAPQTQCAPSASFEMPEKETTTQSATTSMWLLPLDASRLNVSLQLEHRQKGLLWYSTYTVDFAGDYTFINTGDNPHSVKYTFKFPARQAFYDNVSFELDGKPLPFTFQDDGAFANAMLAAGHSAVLHVAYRSHGIDSWNYSLGSEVSQARNFMLRLQTNFKDIDFAQNTLSPTAKRETDSGWNLTWQYTNLISGFQIGMIMPEKLQPGPLAGEISYFAPVSLLLFFFVMFIITTLRGIELHPMNYFFLAAAFFSFHLLLAYLVDHISIHFAFVICSVVSLFLVASYMRLVVGTRFAFFEAGITQLVYLVAFSYTFFLKGFTGLAVTIGCVITLFVVMQATGRIRWQEKFAVAR